MTRGERKLREKLTGKARFPDDFSSKKMLYARTLRAPVQRGILESVEPPAQGEDITLFRAGEIPGLNRITVEGQSMPILSEGQIEYAGQPLLLACGPKPLRVDDFLAETGITLSKEPPLPPPPRHGENQVVYQREVRRGKEGEAFEKLFKGASQVLHGDYTAPPQTAFSAPLTGVTASREGQRLFLTVGTQWPHHLRKTVSEALGIPQKKILIRNTAAGETLNSKLILPTLAACHAALLSWKTRLPVQIQYHRQEEFLASPKRPSVQIRHRTALGPEGGLTAADITITVDGGAYPLFAEEMADQMSLAALGPYRCRNQRVVCRIIRTSKPPRGPVGGLGAEAAFFAAERHTAQICRILDQDRLAWKKANLLPPGTRTASGAKLDSAEPLQDLLDQVTARSDYPRKQAAYELLRKRGGPASESEAPLRGIGLAAAWDGSGFLRRPGPGSPASVELSLDKNGHLRISVSANPDHSPLLPVWAKTAAVTLGLSDNQIEIENTQIDRTPISGPSCAGCSITAYHRLIQQTCETLKKKRFREALPITLRRSYRLPASRRWDKETMEGTPFHALAWGAAVIEVEVDPHSLETDIKNLWMDIDGGTIIHPGLARTAVEAGVMESVGWIREELLAWRDGQVTEQAYRNFRLPGIESLPAMEISFRPAKPNTPAKGIGSLPLNTLPAAYCEAVSQALGIPFNRFPLTPRLIQNYMEEQWSSPST